jgi:hypothetical protein
MEEKTRKHSGARRCIREHWFPVNAKVATLQGTGMNLQQHSLATDMSKQTEILLHISRPLPLIGLSPRAELNSAAIPAKKH